MKFKENHEPDMNDMDDYHNPLSKSKLRIIIVSFIALAIAWALFQAAYAFLF